MRLQNPAATCSHLNRETHWVQTGLSRLRHGNRVPQRHWIDLDRTAVPLRQCHFNGL